MTVTILDGGMGQELIQRAGQSTSLWSVQALIDHPEWVRDVHDAYFKAGAQIATTNTYSVLPDRMEHHGILDRLEPLQRLACQLAVDSRNASSVDNALVAGSLGPLGFSYQPEKCPPAEEAAEIYYPLLEIQNDYVDMFLAETMSSVEQARGVLTAAAAFSKPIWVALSVDDNNGALLRSGEPVTDIVPLVNEFTPDSILINCSVPEAVSVTVPLLRSVDIPIGAYANGFTGICDSFSKIGATVDLLSKREDLDPSAYAEFAQQWVNDGATIIGGCCEVGPAHIAELVRRLDA